MCVALFEFINNTGCPRCGCGEIDRAGADGSVSLNNTRLLTLIGAIHAKGALARFPARGQSMYPTICDGDVLLLAPPPTNTLWPGEIAAFRTPEHGHLVIHRIQHVSPSGYTFQGDAILMSDGLIPYDHLLGVVVGVERHGQVLPWPDRRTDPVHARQAAIHGLIHSTIRRQWLPPLMNLLDSLQHSPVYRMLVGSLIRRSTATFTKISDDAALRVTLQLHGYSVGVAVASPGPADCPYAGWWLSALTLRLRYRGAGLTARLLDALSTALGARGVSMLLVPLTETDSHVETWLRAHGFSDLPRPDISCPSMPTSNVLGKPLQKSTTNCQLD